MGRSKPTAMRLAPPEPAPRPVPKRERSPAPDGASSEQSSDEACQICDRTDSAHTMVLCDGCSDGYHTHCMRPSRRSVPRGAWLCPSCVRLAVMRNIKLRDVQNLVDRRHCFTCRKATGSGARHCVECKLVFHSECLPRNEVNANETIGSEFYCRFCIEKLPSRPQAVASNGAEGAGSARTIANPEFVAGNRTSSESLVSEELRARSECTGVRTVSDEKPYLLRPA
jgi:hypothetical protein